MELIPLGSKSWCSNESRRVAAADAEGPGWQLPRPVGPSGFAVVCLRERILQAGLLDNQRLTDEYF